LALDLSETPATEEDAPVDFMLNDDDTVGISRSQVESDTEIDAEARPSGHLRSHYAVLLILIVCAACIAGSVIYQKRERTSKAVARSIWSEIFSPQRPTVLVPGDSGVVMWQETTQQNLDLPDYISSASPWKSTSSSSGKDLVSNALMRRRYTSIVDLDIIQKLSHRAYLEQVEPVVRYSRDVRPSDLKQSNVVLIGSSETNPWNQMFQGRMNFILHKDQKRMLYTIENRHPLNDEPNQWTSDSLTEMHLVYCKVSYLANTSGEGNVLLLEGTSMAGTQCAWEFISNAEILQKFFVRAGVSNNNFPHFEVLLKTGNLAGESASSDIIAWRLIK